MVVGNENPEGARGRPACAPRVRSVVAARHRPCDHGEVPVIRRPREADLHTRVGRFILVFVLSSFMAGALYGGLFYFYQATPPPAWVGFMALVSGLFAAVRLSGRLTLPDVRGRIVSFVWRALAATFLVAATLFYLRHSWIHHTMPSRVARELVGDVVVVLLALLFAPFLDSPRLRQAVGSALGRRPAIAPPPAVALDLSEWPLAPIDLERDGLVLHVEETRPGLARFEVRGLTAEITLEPADRARGRGIPGATGDGRFDPRVTTQGNAIEIAAYLDRTTRAHWLSTDVFCQGLSVRDKTITGTCSSRAQTVEAIVPSLLEIGRRLRGPVTQRLLQAVEEDPENCLLSLKLLVEHFPEADETRRAAERALASSDVSTRFLAAQQLRDANALLALARDEAAPAAMRATAARKIGERCAAAAALDALGTLVETQRRAPSEVGRAVAWALSVLPDARGEELLHVLLLTLSRSQTEVEREVLAALGRMGTTRSVVVLKNHGGRAAQAAVAQIQSRLEGAERGQVSLASPDEQAGALSEVPEAGAVSIASRTRGKQST